jgi:hypothetical protein
MASSLTGYVKAKNNVPSISGTKLEFLEPYPAHDVASFPMHAVFIASQHIIGTWGKNSIEWA